MLQRYLLFWLLVTSGIALVWPRLELAWDPFVFAGGNGVQALIAVVMFCIGTLLPRDEVDAVFRRWPLVLTGTAVQYISMPLLALCMVHLFSVDAETAAGIMIVGCVPGAMASNVLTMTARGNVSYSVSLTTSATLLSPLVVPLVLRATVSDDVNYDGSRAVTMLTLTVVLPVVAGQLLRRYANFAPKSADVVANLAILGIIAIAVGLQRNRLQLSASQLLLILLLINLGGYLAGYLGGFAVRLPEPMRRALTLEVGMQNAGAGTGLAIHLFGAESPAVIPCILYTFGCMLTGTTLASLWNWLSREEDDVTSDETSTGFYGTTTGGVAENPIRPYRRGEQKQRTEFE